MKVLLLHLLRCLNTTLLQFFIGSNCSGCTLQRRHKGKHQPKMLFTQSPWVAQLEKLASSTAQYKFLFPPRSFPFFRATGKYHVFSYRQISCLQSHIGPPKSYFSTCKSKAHLLTSYRIQLPSPHKHSRPDPHATGILKSWLTLLTAT